MSSNGKFIYNANNFNGIWIIYTLLIIRRTAREESKSG